MIIILLVVYSALFVALACLPIWIGTECRAAKRYGVTWEDQADTHQVSEVAEELPPARPALHRAE